MGQYKTSSNSSNLLGRLDRIPNWPYSMSIPIIVAVGYFFALYDVIDMGIAAPIVAKQFHVTASQAAIPISTGLFGYVAGAILAAILSDSWGRRLGLTISVAMYAIGSFLSAFSPDLVFLDVMRFIAGMGIGAEIAVATAYISELAPAAIRGKYVAYTTFLGFIGISVTPFIGLWLLPKFSWGWRAFLFIGGLGAVILIFIRWKLPESPRWLLAHGHAKQAEDIIINAEETAKNKLGGSLPEIQDAPEEVLAKGFPFLELFTRRYFWRALLLLVIWFVYYIGNYGWIGVAPTLLVSKGFSIVSSIKYLAVSIVGLPIGCLLATWLTEKIHRKYLTFFIGIVWVASLMMIGFTPTPVIIMVFGFIASLTIGAWDAVVYALTAEHYPTRARTSGMAFNDGIGHLGGAIAPTVVMAIGSFRGSFEIMACTGLIALLLALFTLKANKKPLEIISK